SIFSNAARMAGSLISVDFRPPPGRRMRPPHCIRDGPGSDGRGVAGVVGISPDCSNSFIPAQILARDIPVALATRVIPPRPNAIASEAAQRRAIRSSIAARSISYFSLTASMSDMPDPPFGGVGHPRHDLGPAAYQAHVSPNSGLSLGRRL